MEKTIVIAHRGASAYAPENTLPAFKLALDMKAEGLELDIHLTKDGHIVVTHDEWVNRTSNGKGLIKEMSLQQLRELDFGGWFSPEFSDTTIPTLDDVLKLTKDWDGLINIEIKGGYHMYPGIEQKLVETIESHKCSEKIIISSFNHYSLFKIKKTHPTLATGLLYSAMLFEPWVYAKHVGATALHAAYFAIDSEIVKGAHKENILLNPWTVDDEATMQTMFELGVDGLITNKPDVAIKTREKIK